MKLIGQDAMVRTLTNSIKLVQIIHSFEKMMKKSREKREKMTKKSGPSRWFLTRGNARTSGFILGPLLKKIVEQIILEKK